MIVTNVCAGGQADRFCVHTGWSILAVNGILAKSDAHITSLLEAACTCDHTVTFNMSAPERDICFPPGIMGIVVDGLVITEVGQASSAAAHGVQAGWKIVAVNGVEVKVNDDMRLLLGRARSESFSVRFTMELPESCLAIEKPFKMRRKESDPTISRIRLPR